MTAGRYEIVERIGAGGMGEVYLARHVGLAGFRRNVALKRLRATGDDDVERFVDEARICAHLVHPNLVAIYDFGHDDEGFFIAMEYVDGTSLAHALAQPRPISREVAAFVIAELARGAEHAHRARDVDGTPLEVVHRDISPQNVLLSRTGDVKLADFGIARAANRLSRTPPGSMAGKVGYMAPEQLVGEAVDARADVFALGVILWELTLRRSAFDTHRSRDEPVPPPSSLDPAYPPALDRIVRAATAARPGDRPTAAELAQQLEDHLAESGARITRAHVAALVGGDAAPTAGGPHTVITATHAIAVGSRIGAYEVTRRLGEGGMGIVFAAVDQQIGKQVAIKLMRPQFAGDTKAVARFLEEARAVNRIGHPNIVDIFGFGTLDGGAVYCVMELLAGMNLRELLHERGPLSPVDAIAILRPVAAAIDAAHRAGVVHCDLKPDNIFVCDPPGGQIKVLDFGLSQLQGELGAAESVVQIGTPMYMAPEQCRSERGDHRIDIYAFGLVAYNVLTKKLPFESAGALAVIADHIHTDPIAPSAHGLPAAFDAPLLRCLEKDPDRRPESASAAIAAIEAAANPAKRSRTRAVVLGAIGGLLAVGIVVAVVASSRGSATPDAGVVSVLDATAMPDAVVAMAPDAMVSPPIVDAADTVVAPIVDARPRIRPIPPDARGHGDLTTLVQPPTGGLRIELGAASAYNDKTALSRVLQSKRADFARCLVGATKLPAKITVSFKVVARTGDPTGGTYEIVPDEARKIAQCFGQVMTQLSFGPAQREINDPPTAVYVHFVIAPAG